MTELEVWNRFLRGIKILDKYNPPIVRIELDELDEDLLTEDILELENLGWEVSDDEAVFEI